MIVSIPDSMAEMADCSKRARGEEPDPTDFASKKDYGNFYGVGFKLARAGDDAAVLCSIWGQEMGSWKVISYVVLTP